MISKVDSLKDFGIYKSFNWNFQTDIPDFKEKNIIYGWNYSGKTTFSRIFSSLGSKAIFSDYEKGDFKITISTGNSFTKSNIARFPYEVLVFNSDDVGATLKAFGYYKNMVGGDLLVRGVPPENVYRGKLNGLATISNFRVVDAPVLARLLNAMSLTGILQLLGNDGVDFTRLKANFIWEQRYGGAMLTILDGKTAGSAMGLTFQGTIDEAKDAVNIKGTVVPVSMVNDLVSSLPLIGDIITGGGGAVFAATYTITGPTEDPKTSVNPLAVLAPGFLRKLFFEGD